MKRWTLLATLALALIGGSVAWAMDDKDNEKLRKEILKKVEERLKSEHDRVMREVEKIIDEELSKMAEEEEEDEPKPKPKPIPKPKPKPTPEPNNDEPGYMGVYPEDMTADMRKLLKLKDGEGVLIAGVSETGPAAKSGLKANDVVLEVNGDSVGTSDELREAVQGHKAGESVTLTVLRKKERKELKVKLASREEMESTEPEEEEEEEDEDEDTKPETKKPKVTFEKRVDAPKFDDKTAEQLREEIRKFLDETLKKNEENGTPKFIRATRGFAISGPDDEEEDEAPRAPRNGKELKELTKRFLRQLLEKMEQEEEETDPEEEGDEDESPFGMNEEIQRMLEQFKKEHGGQMEELQEKMREMMEKMQDPEALEKMLKGMDPAALQEQLQQWLGQKGLPGGKDEEDLTKPDDDEENKTPPVKPQPQPDKNGKAWLGISPEELSPEMKKQLKVESGVVVRDVVEGSPAAEAGLKEGDVILFIDGEDLDSPEALQKALSGHKPGTKVDLVILRKGKQVTKSVTLAARKKIAVPSDLAPSTHDIGTKPPKKAKKEKKVEKKERREELPFDPATLGAEFMKGQGFKFAILDKNGKVILKQPLERMSDMLGMARKFGMPLDDDDKDSKRDGGGRGRIQDLLRHALGNRQLRDLLENHAPRVFLRDGNDGEKCPFGCPDCEKRQKSMKKERIERHEFKFSGPEGRKPATKRKTERREFEFKVEPRDGERREFRFELPGKGDKKSKGTAEQLEQAHREIEKAMKEFGGKNVPAELKKELHKLMEDLHKAMEKQGNKTRKMIAA